MLEVQELIWNQWNRVSHRSGNSNYHLLLMNSIAVVHRLNSIYLDHTFMHFSARYFCTVAPLMCLLTLPTPKKATVTHAVVSSLKGKAPVLDSEGVPRATS